MDSHSKLDAVYRTTHIDVRPVHESLAHAESYYADYLSFVQYVRPAPGRLLDIGCGGGWSTRLFTRLGYDVVGIDLAPSFEAGIDLTLLRANACNLPFRDESFDVTAAYQTLEHTPEPAAVLDEAVRVLRPGGILCIVGPNLLSLGASVSALTRWVWKNRPVRRILFRDLDMPRHPFGNTIPEIVAAAARNSARIVRKTISSRPVLEMREPDLRPPFHGDNDACFLCNPLDLANYLSAKGCQIIQLDKPGRPRIARLLASGTFLAARKS